MAGSQVSRVILFLLFILLLSLPILQISSPSILGSARILIYIPSTYLPTYLSSQLSHFFFLFSFFPFFLSPGQISAFSATIDKSAVSSVYYSNLFFKRQNLVGACDTGQPGWKSFLRDSLSPPADSSEFTSIQGQFGYENFNTDELRTTKASCNSSSVVQALVAALNRGNNLDIMCQGRLWRVFGCAMGVAICVDCKAGCTEVPGSSFLANPCRLGQNTQFNGMGFTVLKLGMSALPGAVPKFIGGLQVGQVHSDSVEMELHVDTPGRAYCMAELHNSSMIF